ncbi:hypothetical protein EDB81DRAFT_858217 [Dactylonectria macrodidyma]|uniref:Uncharacterized protein n=1 Tax=Dactylonectria macrodidyma TaxID=307937 RepID=A0A9P9DB51_9HYPO|nr:hypothetical protein EDB81DRAFT_862210 [Dactylonectria macrodidyma]KAH7137637.1 hypothetical protein EDB81DRAFT_858217 [Dactylonectria macrodidyma]
MSSPILGDSSSLHERPGGKKINLNHMPLKKHNTSLPANTPTDPNPVDPADGDSTGRHGTSPTRKPGGRRKAKKSNQPARTIRKSERIEKKQKKMPKRDGDTLRTASGRPVPPGTQRAFERFQEQLRLLKEQNKSRLEASQGEPSEKRV